jgi:hypothetical protein
MSFRPRFHRLAAVVIGGVLASILLSFVVVVRPAAAQIPPVFLCGSMFVQNECHFYEELQKRYDSALNSFQFAVVTGLLNAMQFVTQRIAIDTAQWMLNGFKGEGSAFYNKTFGDYVADLGEGAANQFISEVNKFTSKEFGFNLCQPISLNLQLSLGIGRIQELPPPDCTFTQIAESFEQTYRALEPEQLSKTLRQSIQPGGNDISVAISSNQMFLNEIVKTQEAGILDRAEGGGLKPLVDLISGNIQTPAQVAKDTLYQGNSVKLQMENLRQNNTVLALSAMQAGLEQLPIIAASTFLNTLAVGLLEKFFQSLSSVEDEIAKIDLLNPDAQASAELGVRTTPITDILTPNLISQEKQDFLFELSTCTTPRGLWGCSIDSGFVAALQNINENGGYTIARASGIGLNDSNPTNGLVFLNPDWELIPESEAKDNKDPGCYQRAYCATNLAKLRFARIISSGWELAANSPFNKKLNGKYITLGEVLRGFNNCNDQGKLDADHPWCHLIDPSWVLTIPQFQCRIKGFSDSLLGSGAGGVRIQECSDVVSCIERDDKGNCIGGYGYCLSEKTVWRFGADSCSERYVSCRTYRSRDKSKSLSKTALTETATGPEVSYLRNSIDYGSCNAENVGCMFYRNLRNVNVTSTIDWVGGITGLGYTTSNQDGLNYREIQGSRVYFDATAETCAESDAGCTKVLEVRPTQSALNLVKNGSFEAQDETLTTKLVGWDSYLFPAGERYVFNSFLPLSGEPAVAGSASAGFSDPSVKRIHQRVDMAPLRNYVLSAYVRRSANNPTGTFSLYALMERKRIPVVDPESSWTVYPDGVITHPSDAPGTFYTSPNCTLDQPAIVRTTGFTEEWQRYTCEFVTPSDVAYGRIVLSAEGVAVDGIQLEEGTAVTPFIDGVNIGLVSTHIKLPPEELDCQGRDTDHPDCQNYATMCRQIDAGCQGYTEAGGGQASEIPAILSAGDLCPNTCVGYAEYQKMPSGFDLVQNPMSAFLNDPNDETSAHFIPKNAASCSAVAAGCEEFTNVETPELGGESKLYVTYARACLNPSKAQNEGLTRTYFTWEGSDTTGYQLRTWSLIQKGNDPSPFDPVYAGVTAAPRILRKAGQDGIVKDPAVCTEDLWNEATDPDCRQLYDEQGNPYYRYFSQTIVSSVDCRDYRKNGSNFDDCTKTGGEYNQQTNECIYHILSSESASCSAVDASCRAYIGTTGRNTATVLEETFPSSSSTAFVAGSGNTNASLSTESLRVGDYSLRIDDTDSNPLTFGSVRTEFPSATGSLYTVSFWAKSTDAGKKTATVRVNGNQVVGTFQVEVDWRRHELGPFRVSNAATTSTISWGGMPDISFLDEVRVERLQDVVYARQGQWTIPAECDRTTEGVPQPQAMLGCRSYVDRKNQAVDVRQFSRLCRYEAISCTAFVDTRDSEDAYAQTFLLEGVSSPQDKLWDRLYSGTATTTRPADRYVYAVDEPSAHCDVSAASCRAFGKPKFDSTLLLKTEVDSNGQTVPGSDYETVYLKDDITKYVDGDGEFQMLCKPSELFCERYASENASPAVVSYFRDPGPHTCEWKEKIFLSETADYPQGEYSGWFVKDQSPAQPCYPGLLSRGNAFLFEYAGTPNYEGWVATCPRDQSECTEFRDVNDTTDQAHPSGKPYYFINNQKLDKSSCSGKVDPFGGCVLFRDMNDSRLLYSTRATYDKSHAENDNAVAPIDCVKDPSNPYCENVGVCVEVGMNPQCTPANGNNVLCPVGNNATVQHPMSTINESIDELTGAPCQTDNDCTDLTGDSVRGRCSINDSNLILKVKLDRDCTTWLGCSTGETVYDPSQASYVDICTDLAVCDENLGETGKNFCAHYVDRAPAASVTQKVGEPYQEPVLRQGRFVDLVSYTDRPTGFNVPDYSGFSIPNHFQVADLETRRVAYELLVNRKGPARDKYVRDYRLTAVTPLRTGTQQTSGPDELGQFSNVLLPGQSLRYNDPSFEDLNLCQHVQTGRLGYYNPGESPLRCYFAIDSPYSGDVNAVLTNETQFHPRNVTNILTLFEQLERADLEPQLTNAFPNPQCRAYPDAQSPFPNSYVAEWDFTKDPPTPTRFVDGYDGVSYCEWGEECSCSYRKATYTGGVNRHYSMFGAPPSAGVCVGGGRNGQACVPGAILGSGGASPGVENPDDPNNPSRGTEAGGADPADVCQGGTCQPIETVSIVRGQYGYCLQRDASRSISGSQEFNPCLIWNPTPVLFGPNDIYHYQPTAGYLPPQNAGEYYCIASARAPQKFKISALMTPEGSSADPLGLSSWFTDFPGYLMQFHFDEDFISDGDCFACIGNNEEDTDADDITFIDGVHANGGDMGAWCEDADDNINEGHDGAAAGAAAGMALTGEPITGAIIGSFVNTSHFVDTNAGRWVMTGRGENRNYMEYFIPFNTKKWTTSIFPGAPVADSNGDIDPNILLQATTERNFSYFTWDLMVNPNGKGIMGCGATPDWAEGVTISDYDDEAMLSQGQSQFQSYFRDNFESTMTRESADYLRDSDGQLQKVQCLYPESSGSSGDGYCFYKFWEIGYRDDGQTKFLMESVDEFGKRFSADQVYQGKSEASKAFFSIRAMFEDSNPNDNALDENQGGDGNSLSGPFRFVGWWVTASVPGATSERALYMTLEIGNADTCKQVAQVVAPDTREAAAFNDRVWEGSGFSVPLLGYVHSTVNPPFGSAVHTKPIGIDPLFQTRGAIPGTQSKLKPPGFIASGLEYFRAQNYPVGNWSWLNNLFARVYRVYKYYDQAVSENAGFCIDGPNAGAFCPPEAVSGSNNNPQDPDAAKKYCGFVGTCNTYLVDQTDAPGACNALSGVNAGLPCSGDTTDELQGYHICHNAPIVYESGLPTPKYLGCELAQGWSIDDNGQYHHSSAPNSVVFLSDAKDQGAFTCEKGSVRTFTGKPNVCGKIEAESPDCPMEVIGDGNVNAQTVGGPNPDGYVHSGCSQGKCTNGFEHAQCSQDSHCRFTAVEYWGEHNADKPWGGIPGGTQYGILKDLPLKEIVAGSGGDADVARAIYTANENQWFEYYDDGDGYAGDYPNGDGDVTYTAYGEDRGAPGDWAEADTSVGRIWWTDHALIHGGTTYDSGVGDVGPDTDIGGKNLAGGGFIRFQYSADQSSMGYLNRFPGAYAAAIIAHDPNGDDVGANTISNVSQADLALMIPGHCERPPDAEMNNQVNALDTIDEDDPAESKSVYRADKLDKPYAEHTWFCGDDGDYDFDGNGDSEGNIVDGPDCNFDNDSLDEPDVWYERRRYFGGNGEWIYGICEGGASEGVICNQNADCKPQGMSDAEINASAGWCKSPTDPSLADQCTPDTNNDNEPDFACDPDSPDLDKDCNLCTHNSGYYPQTNICGSDPLRPQCLTGYVLGTNERTASVNQDTTLPPTDVTPGFYTPDILGAPQTISQLGYIAYYTPRGPTIAAPDLGRGCSSPGTCPISLVNTFALENRAEGKVAYVGGQAISTIKFYGWTPDNQGGLKDLWVDWGDSTVQEFHDAKMKNRKPICGIGKECQFIPGLTCNSDNDCPPAAGACVNTGSCSARPYVSCLLDSDCGTDDTCIARTGFGSSDLACEQNYFEFTHAYACGPEAADNLPSCQIGNTNNDILRCSRDNTRTCTSNAQCAPGDSCVSGLAPPNGCFDNVQNACRFTPRVLVKDNWGWCTGECRITDLGGGNLSSGAVGLQHVYYKNAGCYDSSPLYKNTNPAAKISGNNGQPANSCDPQSTAGTSARPWIIYRGSLQLGILEQ